MRLSGLQIIVETTLYIYSIISLLLFFYPQYQRIPRCLEKLEENCRSDHYSGQSSNTKESCSSTPLNRCTSTETRWNNKSCISLIARMTNFLRQKREKVRDRLINWAESLDRNWLKKVVCCNFFLILSSHCRTDRRARNVVDRNSRQR